MKHTFNHRKVTDNKGNFWHVTGYFNTETDKGTLHPRIRLSDVHGDITNLKGISEAVNNLVLEEGWDL